MAKRGGSRKKPIAHGTPNGYWNGCRQDCCRKALSDYNRKRKGLPPAGAFGRVPARVGSALPRRVGPVLDVEVVNGANVMAQLDRANRRSFAAALPRLLAASAFRQAFVIAHTPETLEALPGRIVITNDGGNATPKVIT